MKTTLTMICARASIARADLTEEAQKLFDLYNDPSIAPEQKEIVRKELDAMIKKLEERVETTRRIREEKAG